MPERRATRFLCEVLFLVGLAVALSFADVRPLEIAGVMLLGWVLAAIFEWASLRGEPHYGRGLPPRYFVPQISLPPALPLERPADVFPVAPVESPTWIVPAGETNDWPWLREPDEGAAADETQVVEIVEAATAVARIAVEQSKPGGERKPRPATKTRAPTTAEPARRARHRLDPLAPQAARRRSRRELESGAVEVPARPERRILPGSARRGED